LDLGQLSLWNPIPVEDDPGGLEAGRLVELDEQLPHHVGQILDDLLPGPLDADGSAVPAGVGVHTAYHLEREREREREREMEKPYYPWGIMQQSASCFCK